MGDRRCQGRNETPGDIFREMGDGSTDEGAADRLLQCSDSSIEIKCICVLVSLSAGRNSALSVKRGGTSIHIKNGFTCQQT